MRDRLTRSWQAIALNLRQLEADLENGKEVDTNAIDDTAVALQTAWDQLKHWEGANDIENFMLVNNDDGYDRYALDIEALDDAGWRHVTTVTDREQSSEGATMEIWCTPSLEYVFFYQEHGFPRTGAVSQERLDKVKVTPGFLLWLATKIPSRQSRR